MRLFTPEKIAAAQILHNSGRQGLLTYSPSGAMRWKPIAKICHASSRSHARQPNKTTEIIQANSTSTGTASTSCPHSLARPDRTPTEMEA